MKLTLEEKLKYVKLHVEKGVTIREIKEKYGFDKSTLKYQCLLYQRYGDKAFKQDTSKLRTYTRLEKLKAIKQVLTNEMSSRQIALNYMLTSPKIVEDWVYLYKTKGEAAIKDTHAREAYKTHEQSVFKKEYKKLLEDLERTKAENDFLKKSFPQALKRSRQLKKK